MNRPRATVLILALGRRFYFDLAVNLARSFLRFHKTDDIALRIVTDRDEQLPTDLTDCEVLRVKNGQFGQGFSPKLHLDTLAPGGATLYLDSDILLYEPLDRLLNVLHGRAVAVVGREIKSGEWFGDVGAYCSSLGVVSIPKFNGGLYYFETGPSATAVFETARELASRYDELGLVRLRGHPNDELVMAGAMACHGLHALPDDGSYMGDPMACPGPSNLNVLRARRLLINPPAPSPKHQTWNPFQIQSPMLVHFLGEHALLPQYRTEALRLKLAARKYPIVIANLVPLLCILWPGQITQFIKGLVRPLLHTFFGPRRIQRTPRE